MTTTNQKGATEVKEFDSSNEMVFRVKKPMIDIIKRRASKDARKQMKKDVWRTIVYRGGYTTN